MHRQFRIAAAALGLCCVIAHAQDPVEESEVTTQGPTGDVIVITGQGPALEPVPSKGMDKSQVTRAFGQPAQRHAPVGGEARFRILDRAAVGVGVDGAGDQDDGAGR